MKNKYSQELEIPRKDLDRWTSLLGRSDIDYEAEQWSKYATVAQWTVKFPDGCEADLKVNTNTPEDGDCWCEAVLFDADGRELDCSEVEYELEGPWILSTRDTDYFINVKGVEDGK